MEQTENSADEKETITPIEDKPKKRRNPFNTQQLKEEKERRQKKKARLIIRNISFKATEEQLRKHFEQWGELEDVQLLKRKDGKLVGCAFVQYATVNQASKAVLKGNNKPLLGRNVSVDFAIGKDEYTANKKEKEEPTEKKPKLDIKEEEDKEVKEEEDGTSSSEQDSDGEDKAGADSAVDTDDDSDDEEEQGESDEDDEASDGDAEVGDDEDEDDDEDKKTVKSKLKINKIKQEKHISNDVQEGCTVFIKNVSFDVEDADLRKACRKFGPIYYAIINRESVSGHSKGTAFVKFKTKESADLCLQAGTEFVLMDQVLDPHPALSREEIRNQKAEKSKGDESKDSRNLYLAREGLIMTGSKAAEDVSASDMNKRHKLEQVKTQVLKNLNRFISRNRLSVHNLPINYDNDNLKQMAITYTGFRPHECRVMRENRITPEHPKGKSKGFGFLSFNTHQEALTALRKLNNNPKVFGTQHRPIVAFSIEDRAVHKIKEKRTEKSKVNNPTYQEKLEKRKELRKQKTAGKLYKKPPGPLSDDKAKLKNHIKKLEETRAAKANSTANPKAAEEYEAYVGTAAKPGTALRMRSNKKINEQSQEHKKRVKADKRKAKQKKIKQMHLEERMQNDRPKQGRKVERDDLKQLVNKYKRMIDTKANASTETGTKIKKPKRTKWYKE